MGATPQNKNIHFEVLGLKNTSWSILKIEPHEDKALKLAEEKWKTGAFKAVKVVRERLNPKDGSYRTSEVYLKGSEPKEKKRKGSSTACWKPADLTSYEGRRTITKLLGSDLEKWQITTIELVHVPDHYYRLDDTGVLLQNAVQKAAIEQVKGTDTSIQDRMKELYSIIEIAITQLNEVYKEKSKIPNLTKLGIDGVIEKLEKQEDRSYVLTLSIMQAFLDIKTIKEKFSYLLSIIKPDQPSWVHTTADSIVAELLGSPSVFRNIRADLGGLDKTLIAFAQLSMGCAQPENSNKDISALNKLIELDRLRQTKLAIYGRIANELRGREDLGSGGVLGELKAVHSIIKTLRGPEDGSISDFRLIDAIDERGARCLSQQNITEFLYNKKGGDEQVMGLLDLEQYVQGETSLRKLGNYFMPIITASENETLFRAIDNNYLERLKLLSRIQRRVIQTKLPEGHKNKIAERLDEYCLNIMKNTQILPKLRKDAQGPIKAGQRLLHMMAGGYFTAGQSSSIARTEARNYMRLPNFIEKCITGTTEEEKAQSLMALQKLLKKSGMAANKSGS